MGGSVVSTGLGLLSVLVLVVLNGAFVAAEFALVSVRQTRIAQLAQVGSARARLVQQALAQLDTYIAATQLGITMASLALGFIGKPAIATVLEPLLARVLPGANVGLTAHGVALGVAEPFYDTLGGYVFGQLGRAAAVGDELTLPDGRRLRVADLDGWRIARVLLLPRWAPDHDGHPHPSGTGDGGAAA